MGLMQHPDPALAEESLAQRRLSLPAGVPGSDGRMHRVVRVRQLTGADEEALFGAGSGAQRVSALLGRVIESVEGLATPIDGDFAADLQLGDRDYLLLRLRQMDLGDAVHQVMRCGQCAAKVDVDLLISELPVRRLAAPQAQYRVRFEHGDTATELSLRLPTGRDQAAIEALALANPAHANTRLFARLVGDVDGRGAPSEDEVRHWPAGLRAQLTAWLQAQLPGPDLFLDLSCPQCRADMSYAFDLAGFFLPNAWRT